MDNAKVLYWCGMEIPSLIITSPPGVLEVVFQSDGMFESTGFRIIYSVKGKNHLLFISDYVCKRIVLFSFPV